MTDPDRYRLRFGPYRMPKCKIGKFLTCGVRGEKKVVGISDAPISWPQAANNDVGRPYLILCGDLVKAIRRESATAVAHWWGVTNETVSHWRRSLGVTPGTEGTKARLRELFVGRLTAEVVARRTTATAEAQRKRRGRKAPRHVIEAMRKANLGRKNSAESLARMSEAARRCERKPPPGGRLWMPEEDEAVRTLPGGESLGSLSSQRAAAVSKLHVSAFCSPPPPWLWPAQRISRRSSGSYPNKPS